MQLVALYPDGSSNKYYYLYSLLSTDVHVTVCNIAFINFEY